MTVSIAIRWSGMAAILSGLLNLVVAVLPAELVSPGPTLAANDPIRWLYWAVGLATLFTLMGVYASQVEESGILGLAGFGLAAIGFSLFLAEDVINLAGGIATLGMILLGISTWTAGKFPRWVPGLWLVAVVVGVPGAFLPDLMQLLNRIAGLAFALGLFGAGYTMWSQQESEPALAT